MIFNLAFLIESEDNETELLHYYKFLGKMQNHEGVKTNTLSDDYNFSHQEHITLQQTY